MECLHMYLLKDGPNLGRQSFDIHKSFMCFVFDNWFTVDHDLKEAFILYMKLQLHLIRVNEIEDEVKAKDGIPIVEQLLEVLSKELDQCSVLGISASRVLSEANVAHSYDGLLWTLRSLHHLSLLLLPLMSMEKGSLKSSSNKADVAFRLLGDMVSHDI